jgi:hypothetical protein
VEKDDSNFAVTLFGAANGGGVASTRGIPANMNGSQTLSALAHAQIPNNIKVNAFGADNKDTDDLLTDEGLWSRWRSVHRYLETQQYFHAPEDFNLYLVKGPSMDTFERLITLLAGADTLSGPLLGQTLPRLRWAGIYHALLLNEILPQNNVYTLVLTPSVKLLKIWSEDKDYVQFISDKSIYQRFEGRYDIVDYNSSLQFCLKLLRHYKYSVETLRDTFPFQCVLSYAPFHIDTGPLIPRDDDRALEATVLGMDILLKARGGVITGGLVQPAATRQQHSPGSPPKARWHRSPVRHPPQRDENDSITSPEENPDWKDQRHPRPTIQGIDQTSPTKSLKRKETLLFQVPRNPMPSLSMSPKRRPAVMSEQSSGARLQLAAARRSTTTRKSACKSYETSIGGSIEECIK